MTDTSRAVFRILSRDTWKVKVSSKIGFKVFCLIDVRFFSIFFPSCISQIFTYGSAFERTDRHQMQSTVLYLYIYIALFAVHTNQKRFQCERPREQIEQS